DLQDADSAERQARGMPELWRVDLPLRSELSGSAGLPQSRSRSPRRFPGRGAGGDGEPCPRRRGRHGGNAVERDNRDHVAIWPVGAGTEAPPTGDMLFRGCAFSWQSTKPRDERCESITIPWDYVCNRIPGNRDASASLIPGLRYTS